MKNKKKEKKEKKSINNDLDTEEEITKTHVFDIIKRTKTSRKGVSNEVKKVSSRLSPIKNEDNYQTFENPNRKVKINEHVDVVEVECWKKYNVVESGLFFQDNDDFDNKNKKKKKNRTFTCACSIF